MKYEEFLKDAFEIDFKYLLIIVCKSLIITDEEYSYEYDSNLNYENWNLMVETKAILYVILKKYLATEEQKEHLKKRERYSIIISEKIKKEKYNPDNLFKIINKKEDIENNNLKPPYDLTEYKESFFIKIKKFFLNYCI